MDRNAFEKLVDEAVRRIPQKFRDALDNVAIVIHDEPGPEADEEGIDERLYGLYRGIPLPDRSVQHSGTLPDVIYIYQRPLEEDFPDREDLCREVEITVAHEIAHYFGFDDETLRRFGYG